VASDRRRGSARSRSPSPEPSGLAGRIAEDVPRFRELIAKAGIERV